MKTAELINKIQIKRISINFAVTAIICIFIILSLYSLFMILPSLFIKTGFISRIPLLFIFILTFIIPLLSLSFRFPFYGDRFFKTVVLPPYSSSDIRTAIDLEKGMSYPENNNPVSEFLSEKFNSKIRNFIINESGIKKIINKKHIILLSAVVLTAATLTAVKIEFAADVVTALKTGLPVELVAIDKSVKFKKIEAQVIPPAYIDRPSEITDLNIKSKVNVMQGSGISIRGVHENLNSGRLILSTDNGIEYYNLSVSGNSFEVTFLAPMKGAFAIEVNLIKNAGDKTSGKSKIYSIAAIADNPPAIKILSPSQDFNLLFGNSVNITYSASDDNGILEITLYHRNPDENGGYNTDLVVRFPKNPKQTYASTYSWNPVLREGNKVYELVYQPGTKTVEYFLEVKDTNTFSSGGTARTEKRYLHFTDMLDSLKKSADLIHELIDDGKKLLMSIDNKKMLSEYKKKLIDASSVFTKELNETMPQSSLVQKTDDMISVLYIESSPVKKSALKNYIAYLERYLAFTDLLLQTEALQSADKESSRYNNSSKDMKNSLNRISSIADLLEKEFKKDIERIKELEAKGEHEKAKREMAELLKRIREKLSQEQAKSSAASKKISKEVKEKLQKISKDAGEIINAQETNRIITDNHKLKQAQSGQEKINAQLNSLNIETDRLGDEYPFIMYSLKAYTGAAELYGVKAMQNLKKLDYKKSLQDQQQVIRYLKNLINDLARQAKLMDDLAEGKSESSSGKFANRFVLIPKEAAYTIPIDYKNKIIEMSKDRNKTSPEKEAFWRDILE